MQKWYSREFIEKIPKTDLHVHLDGSLRTESLIDLAKDQGIEMPSYTVEGLNELVFKENYQNLDEYLHGFAYTCAVLHDKESLERVAYELFIDNALEGVRYLEVRFAPQLNMSDKLSFEEVMIAVDSGLKRAQKELNAKIKDDEPPFEYGIIVCAMRFFTENFSPYYKSFYSAHTFSKQTEIIRYASMELAKAAVRLKKETDIQLVAFDLAGSEYGYPASAHEDSYDFVHKGFLNKTVHAGEAYGPESIFQAITKLHADRIGHGLHLFNKDMIVHTPPEGRDQYIQNLINYIADHRTTLEVCLTSNLQTSPNMKSVKKHSLGKMLEHQLSLSFCTDNRLVSHTTVTDEIMLALDNFDISPKQLRNIIVYGFKRSFYYGSYQKKREYVRKIINYYNRLEKEMVKETAVN